MLKCCFHEKSGKFPSGRKVTNGESYELKEISSENVKKCR